MSYVHCTVPVGATLRRPDATLAVLWPGCARPLGHVRNVVFAACLSMPAAMILHAEEAPQGWVPDALDLPADMDVLSDRAIGSNLRMFSFSTERDPEALLAEWEESLRQAGYKIDQAKDEILSQAIEFSGQGISNAKIIIAPTNDGERVIVEFDATLQ